MVSFAGINWLAVIVGVVVSNALGFLWYGPLFGNAWMRMIGKRREEIQSEPSMYIITMVASAITMVVLAVIVRAIGSANLLEGALAGAVTWLGIGGLGEPAGRRPGGCGYVAGHWGDGDLRLHHFRRPTN